MNWLTFVITAVAFACYGALLLPGWRNGALQRYPLFFCFIAWSVVRDLLCWAALLIWGYESMTFGYVSAITGLTGPIFQILLLIEIYFVVRTRESRGHWVLLGIFVLVMGWYAFNQNQVSFFHIFHSLTLYFQALFCILLNYHLFSNRTVVLGRNLTGLLMGLSVVVAIQSCTYMLTQLQWMDPLLFNRLIQPLSLLSLVIWCIGMWRFDPPRPVDDCLTQELDELESSLAQAWRSVR